MPDPACSPLTTIGAVAWRLVQVAGVVAAIAYLAQRILVEPVIALRSAIRDLDGILTDTARWWGNPMTSEELRRSEPALHELREEAARLAASVSELGARSNAVAWRPLWLAMRLLPAQADVQEAAKLLRGVANHFRSDWEPTSDAPPPGRQNQIDVARACKLLGLPDRS